MTKPMGTLDEAQLTPLKRAFLALEDAQSRLASMEQAARERPGSGVRAYGEMVDLLWRDGDLRKRPGTSRVRRRDDAGHAVAPGPSSETAPRPLLRMTLAQVAWPLFHVKRLLWPEPFRDR